MFQFRRGPIRGLVALSIIAAAATGGVASAQATAEAPSAISAVTLRYNIPAQDLTAALTAFAHQSRAELIYAPDAAEGRQSATLNGAFSAVEAVEQILQGTGLDFVVTDGGGIMIGEPDVVAEYRRRLQNSSTGNLAVAQAKALADDASPTDAPLVDIDSARRAGVEEIIVTGQKKAERLQDVPIAISAFDMESLDAKKIEGGFDLLKAIPNVTFSKTNFSGYNFQIRGIGTQAISATTDPGVAVSFNNTTLIVNRLFEQEYLDIERVEVLRGPQGTLYGRNATAGVINVISAKPEMGVYSGEWKMETGNFSAQRLRGHVNVPLGDDDTLAARLAFAMTRRDGYGTNLAAGQSFAGRAPLSDRIDDRDLWTGRVSLGWQPNDRLRANFIYERFEEDDRRMRSTKQLCHHATGEVLLQDEAGNPVTLSDAIPQRQKDNPSFGTLFHTTYRGQLSQGCLPGSLFDKGDLRTGDQGAYGTPNGNSSPFVRAGRGSSFFIWAAPAPFDPDCVSNTIVSDCALDPLATQGGQSRDLRAIFSLVEPRYQATSELLELSFDYELSDGLTLSSQSLYMENDLFSTQDFLRYQTLPMFGDSRNSTDWRRYASPGGIVRDPQLGPSDRLLMQDVSQQDARQFSQEFRLVSRFDGPLNFSIGTNYTRFETVTDYFVFINALTALVYGGNVYSGIPTAVEDLPPGIRNAVLAQGWSPEQPTLYSVPGMGISSMTIGCGPRVSHVDPVSGIGTCIYVQPGEIRDVAANPEGHHFFLSRNPYGLDAASLFGELYYDLTPALKLTAGVRLNWDRKTFTPVPSQTMLADWRGRQEGGFLGSGGTALPDDIPILPRCDPATVSLGLFCALGGMAENGRGYPALPDIVQEWRVPTGRIGLDWKPQLDLGWWDETLLYGFYTRGYKAGGANPPLQSAPSGLFLEAAQGAAAPPLFKAEYVNAFEIGSKNRLFDGRLNVNGSAFYYDYTDYQISKILDRSANNENVDATVWGLELELVFAPSADTLLNASIGYLKTRIADGERSLDLMDRTQGGHQHFVDPSWASLPATSPDGQPGLNCDNAARRHVACDYPEGFDQWVVIRPTLTQASSCVAPALLVYQEIQAITNAMPNDLLSQYCPGGRLVNGPDLPLGYAPLTSAPNGSAGFLAEVGGHELPNAPRHTVSLGAQQTFWIPGTDWSATGRVDWYWQDESFHRIYNTEYDRLRAWTNTNLALWFSSERLGLTVEAYVKNVFDETPVTGAFLNSDDTGLSTNVFTLDPRLIGLSVRKRF